jgi:hypothetical protein
MVVVQQRIRLDIKNTYFQDKNSLRWQDSRGEFWGFLADFFLQETPGINSEI